MTKQKTLEPVADEPRETDMIRRDPEVEPHEGGAIADLRSGMMLVPAERIHEALTQYDERRGVIRKYLLSKLVRGVHFGVPPGCEPRGNVNPEQWQNKPSLYKAGAETVCDLMGVRAVFATDLDAWRQLGEPKGTFVIKCILVSQSTGAELGEGMGCFKVGEKKMAENAALKMAEKRAKVDAVLNTYGLSDLFTQDLEDTGPAEHDNPAQRPNSPQARERLRRATKDELAGIFAEWQTCHRGDGDEFRVWASEVLGEPPAALKQSSTWTKEMTDQCHEKLRKERGEPE